MYELRPNKIKNKLANGEITTVLMSPVAFSPDMVEFAGQLGFDGIWIGILLVKMMEIGYVTPPLGFNVFVIHGMNPHVPLSEIFKQSTRFIAADIFIVILLILFPFLVYYN